MVLLSPTQQQAKILAAIPRLPAYEQPLAEALGLAILAEVRAGMQLPNFDNSAMDGYAVRAAEVLTASRVAPVFLPIAGESAAGKNTLTNLPEGTAASIMTGAPVPVGADAVVPVEWTERHPDGVLIKRAAELGRNIRRAGEDISQGDLLVAAGTVLRPRHLALLAAVGIARVPVAPKPRVVIISTGAELREPGEKLEPDSIYDANSYFLTGAVRQAGAVAYRVGRVSDEPDEFLEVLNDQLVRADLVITTGGVSKGDYDVVKAALQDGKMGQMEFVEIAMQPGKPQGFGFVGEDRIPLLALPGNPVSTAVSFEVFVLPALRKMMGQTPHARPMARAVLTKPIGSTPGKQQYVRAFYQLTTSGATVEPVGGHGSHLLGGMAAANALIVVPMDEVLLDAGQTVPVLLLDRDF